MNLQLYKNFMPSVSVILPTYNRSNILKRAVESVIKQSFDKWELIIVDDGSDDNTYQLVDNFIKTFEKIKYIKHSNRKPPLSFNAGIQTSCGEFITFLGSDDEFETNHLIQRINYMRQNPDIDLIHGGFIVIGNPYVKDKNDLNKLIHLDECIVGGTFFGKRKVFFELEGFKNLKYSDDSEFLERASVKFNVRKVDYPTYIYHRDLPDSICNNI